MDFNPERRTQFALNNLGPEDPLIKDIINQKELYSGFTLDLSISKTWMIKSQYRLGVNLFINNILDNQKLALFAFEQSRFDFDTKNIDKFPPKYMYAYGRTYMLLIKLSF
jgi:outer membrane receptor protein involved in Fe transport